MKTQISLGTRPVWSESSQCAQLVAKDPSFLHADSEVSDQTGRMPRLIWVFAGRTCLFVGFVMMAQIVFQNGMYCVQKTISEDTQGLQLSHSKAFLGHQKKERWRINNDKTKQTAYVRPPTREQRRIATKELPCNGQNEKLLERGRSLTLSVPWRYLSSAFVSKTNYGLERRLYVKLEDWMSNSVDPDETAHYKPSHLDLSCLQKSILSPVAVRQLNKSMKSKPICSPV